MLNKTPTEVIIKTLSKIPGNIKVTFISAFIFGLLTHLFMLTNSLPNHDEALYLVGNLEWAASVTGRWFMPYVAAISSKFSMPWVNGLLSMLYISVSACFIVSIVQVEKKIYCALISGIMVTIPTVASIFAYMQHADPYFFCLMLVCFAAFLSERYKYGYIIAIIPIVLSLAIYQAFFGVVVALLILVLILEVLDNQTTWQKTVFKGIRFVGTLGVSMIMYLATVRILYPDGFDIEYQDLNQMGQLSLSDLPLRIITAYKEILKFFVLDIRNFHYSFINFVFVLSFVACGVLIALLCIKKKIHKEPLKLLLLSALLLLFPLGCNIVYLMGPVTIHDQMVYGTIFIFVFLIIVVDMCTNNGLFETPHKKRIADKITSISSWIITLTIVMTMFNYWIVSNQAYFKLNIGYQTAYAQSVLLMSHIQSMPGYTYDMDIVLVGSAPEWQGIPELDQITVYGALGPEQFGSWTYPHFLRNYLNITQNVVHLRFNNLWTGVFSDDEFIINALDIVRDMPRYPDSGSIVIIDNVIYVRFITDYALTYL